jgi:hypothetical protein
MPNLIEIGKGTSGPVRIDVDVLLRTRLLLQANSGGGKSWLLRVLAEQLAGKVQTIIIDPEGEFSTLRERFDFFLVGKGGDTPARVDTAAIAAHKLLELGCSAVCDLFEMKVDERHEWVAAFLEALVDAPKSLWHPAVIMVDEAHVFAPEKGAGESVALEGMAALATRGRKRGFALVAATQRLGKFRKDVAAELQNVLVGQTFLDIDSDRAMDNLGIARGDRKTFAHDLKVMEPGTFFALGRAVSIDRIRVQVRGVQSSHPEPGSSKHSAAAPPPPAKIRAILAKLGDLPKEAEEKKATEASLRERIRELDGHIKRIAGELDVERRRQPAPAPRPNPLPVPVVFKEDLVELERVLIEGARNLNGILAKIQEAAKPIAATKDRPDAAVSCRTAQLSPVTSHKSPRARDPVGSARVDMPEGCRKALTVLAQFPDGVTRRKLGILAGYAPGGSSMRGILAHLRKQDPAWVEDVAGDVLRGSRAGLDALGSWEPLPSGDDLRRHWLAQLEECPRRILEALVEAYPDAISKEDIEHATARTGTAYTAGGSSMRGGLAKLRGLDLVDDLGSKADPKLRASDHLFDAPAARGRAA